MHDQNSYLTIKESALRLNLKESRVRTAIRKNEVAYHKFGKLIRIKTSDLDAWANRKVFQINELPNSSENTGSQIITAREVENEMV